jgi:hypothetical protein
MECTGLKEEAQIQKEGRQSFIVYDASISDLGHLPPKILVPKCER